MSRTDCNLFKEWARGIMYRSGREMDDFLAVYVTDLILFGILLVALFLAGVFVGN
jgi:hypothetical protein